MTTRALSADTARKTALEDCENKIKSAFRRGLLATCDIAKELHKILKDELYTEVTPEFTEYLTISLRMDLRTYRRIIAVSQTIAQLQHAGLELPANETQAAELARLKAPLRPKVWSDLLSRALREEKNGLTTEDVKHAVEAAEEAAEALRPAEEPARSGGGIEVDMEDQDNGAAAPAAKKAKPPVQEGEVVLTEKGEAALNRIRKICGDLIANAVASGTRAMTEREIRNWAEYDDAMMRLLVYYIVDQNWPLSKAVAFENKASKIEDSTDVHDLILIAAARGGSAQINYDNRARIVIELTQ